MRATVKFLKNGKDFKINFYSDKEPILEVLSAMQEGGLLVYHAYLTEESSNTNSEDNPL